MTMVPEGHAAIAEAMAGVSSIVGEPPDLGVQVVPARLTSSTGVALAVTNETVKAVLMSV